MVVIDVAVVDVVDTVVVAFVVVVVRVMASLELWIVVVDVLVEVTLVVDV